MNKGNFLSETSYYTIKEVKTNGDVVANIVGTAQEVTLSKQYVDALLKSAHSFTETEKVNQTDLIKICLANPRTAMTVYFRKADKDKTKKAFDAEKAEAIQKVQTARVGDIPGLLSDLIDNPITKVIPGEMRIIVGYHAGIQDERGYLQFYDSEKDNVFKAINTRTFEYIIVDNKKYILK